MIFESSNGRTYQIDFNRVCSWLGDDQFWIAIVKGDPIRVDDWDDGSGDNRCYALVPCYDKISETILWDNPLYHDSKITMAFVPDDLREFCDKVVRNLVLL